MNTRKAIEIASRLYGLYLLVHTPLALLGVLNVFTIKQEEFINNPMLYRISACLYPPLYLVIGLFLTFKAEAIAKSIIGLKSRTESKEEPIGNSHLRLSFWIILLGLYIFVNSASSFIGDLFKYHWRDSYSWGVILSDVFLISASIVMVVKNEAIEFIIQSRFKR